MNEDCLGCRGGSVHHTCGRTPDAREADEAVVLTEDEAAVLALRLIIQQAENAEDWLLWENLPMLAEGSFEALSGWVEVVANRLRKDLRDRERGSEIDTTALLERSQ